MATAEADVDLLLRLDKLCAILCGFSPQRLLSLYAAEIVGDSMGKVRRMNTRRKFIGAFLAAGVGMGLSVLAKPTLIVVKDKLEIRNCTTTFNEGIEVEKGAQVIITNNIINCPQPFWMRIA